MIQENVKKWNQISGRLPYVSSQPAMIPSSRSMLSRDKRLLLDTWNTSGLQENFFGNPLSTFDAPRDHPQGIYFYAPQRERGSVPQATRSGTLFKQNRSHTSNADICEKAVDYEFCNTGGMSAEFLGWATKTAEVGTSIWQIPFSTIIFYVRRWDSEKLARPINLVMQKSIVASGNWRHGFKKTCPKLLPTRTKRLLTAILIYFLKVAFRVHSDATHWTRWKRTQNTSPDEHTRTFLVRTPRRIIRTPPVRAHTLAQGEKSRVIFSVSHPSCSLMSLLNVPFVRFPWVLSSRTASSSRPSASTTSMARSCRKSPIASARSTPNTRKGGRNYHVQGTFEKQVLTKTSFASNLLYMSVNRTPSHIACPGADTLSAQHTWCSTLTRCPSWISCPKHFLIPSLVSRHISRPAQYTQHFVLFSLSSTSPFTGSGSRLITSRTHFADSRDLGGDGFTDPEPRTGYEPERTVDNPIVTEQEIEHSTEESQIREIEDKISFNQSLLSSTQDYVWKPCYASSSRLEQRTNSCSAGFATIFPKPRSNCGTITNLSLWKKVCCQVHLKVWTSSAQGNFPHGFHTWNHWVKTNCQKETNLLIFLRIMNLFAETLIQRNVVKSLLEGNRYHLLTQARSRMCRISTRASTTSRRIDIKEKALRETQIRSMHEMGERRELGNYELKKSLYRSWEKVM